MNLRKTIWIPATSLALIYAALGRPDEAWTWLELAAQELDPWRVGLAQDLRFRCFWNDARFPRLLRTIGLPSLSTKRLKPLRYQIARLDLPGTQRDALSMTLDKGES